MNQQKVQLVFCFLDLKSKQLVASNRGELFLFTWQDCVGFCDNRFTSSNVSPSRKIEAANRSNLIEGRVLQSSNPVAAFAERRSREVVRGARLANGGAQGCASRRAVCRFPCMRRIVHPLKFA